MEKRIVLDHAQSAIEIFGSINGNLNVIEQLLEIRIDITDDGLLLSGDQESVNRAAVVCEKLIELERKDERISLQLVNYLADLARQDRLEQVSAYSPDNICVTAKGRPIRSKTIGQKKYIDAIARHDITFAIGPAGTGKTFLAVAMAVNAFRAGQVSRIILTRPAVEAGEKLGFLPGDLQNKVDPYMRPLYDSLHELMGTDQYIKNLENGLIEVSPLAYMRGRTLDDAFIILDEAQNTTPEQMKMFLTRLGYASKAVVNGDITQIDLPSEKRSGLIEARRILCKVNGLSFVELTKSDVVRNPLVQKIIAAYEKAGFKGG